MKRISVILAMMCFIFLCVRMVYANGAAKAPQKQSEAFNVDIASYVGTGEEECHFDVTVNFRFTKEKTPCEVAVKPGDIIHIRSFKFSYIVDKFLEKISFYDDKWKGYLKIDDGPMKLVFLDASGVEGYALLKGLSDEEANDVTTVVANVDDIESLTRLSSLEALILPGTTEENIEKLCKQHPKLKSLELFSFPLPFSLKPVEQLTDLQYLWLLNCPGLEDLTPLGKLKNLKSLRLWNCLILSDLKPLENLESLKNLEIIKCYKVQDLKPLANLTSLERIEIFNCFNVSALNGLEGLKSLQYLELVQLGNVTNLDPLAHLKSLKKLYISDLNKITSLEPIGELSSLEDLTITNCKQVHNIKPLMKLTNLKKLRLGLRGMKKEDMEKIIANNPNLDVVTP